MVTPPVPIRWWVAFIDVETRPGLARRLLGFLRPGFRHCLAFREAGCGLLIVQTTVARVQADWFPGVSERDYIDELKAKGATVELLETEADDARYVPRITTCVELVRGLAGWPSRFQTPSALHAEIRRRRV